MSITITVEQARVWMELHPDAIIVDVRTPAEYATAHIRGAILLPVDEIETRAQSILPDKEALILIYCRSGRRSLDAVNILRAMGYVRAFDFGGIIDWPYGVVY
jgi:rhodanese-related sulfurtransferase